MLSSIYLLAPLALIIIQVTKAEAVSSFYNDYNTVTIRSVIRSTAPNGRISASFFTESYSLSSRIAKIVNSKEQDFMRMPPVMYYYMRNRNLTVLIDSNKRCKESNLDEFAVATRMNLINRMIQSDDPLIIGPAQLMKFASDNYSKMREAKSQTATNFTIYNLPLDLSGRVTVSVFYPSTSSIPSRVEICEIGKDKVSVNFLHVKNMDQLGSWMRGQEIIADVPKLDAFSLPRLSGCYDELQKYGLNLFGTFNSLRSTKFTFKAEIVFTSTIGNDQKLVTSDHFVAHHGALQLMRVETSKGESRLYNLYERVIDFQQEEPVLDADQDAPSKIIEMSSTSGKFNCHRTRLDLIGDSKLGEELEFVSIGRLLVGVDNFVHLGGAQVRGVNAEVFEAETKSLPIWLEPPIWTEFPVSNERPELEFRKYNILVYLASDKLDQARPLLMEIYEVRDFRPTMLFASISVREFAWNLEAAESPRGLKPIDFFSLPDCHSSGLLYSQSAEIEMILQQTGSPESISSFYVAPLTRNLAVLGVLNEFLGVPAEMIHDVESEFLTQVLNSTEKRSLVVKFKLSDSILAPKVNLKFLAKKQVEKARLVRKEPTLVACYLRAASSESKALDFAYSRLTKNCYLGLDLSVTNHEATSSHMEINVFGVKRQETMTSQDDMSRVLKNFRWQVGKNNLGKKVLLRGLDVTDFEYFVDRVNIQEHESQVASANFGFVGENRLVGLALASSNVGFKSMSLNTANGLSHCQSVCFKDLNCNSFSICLSGMTLSCATSSSRFAVADLVEQLDGQSLDNSGRRVSVQVFDDKSTVNRTIELERHTNCELHTKNYIGMFRSLATRSKNYRTNSLQVTTMGPEDCARKCFENNLAWIESYAQVKSSVEIVVKARQYCEQFGYSDGYQLSEAIRKYFHMEPTDFSAGGYCLFTHDWSLMPDYVNNSDGSDELGHFAPPELYEFKSELLFESEYGIGLKKSTPTREQAEVYQKVENGESLTPRQLQVMRDSIEGVVSSQEVTVLDDTQCAFACLMQITSPSPFCRSFDVVEKVEKNLAYKECRLNSATLRDILEKEHYDLVDTTAGVGHRVWHYEPMIYTEPEVLESIAYDHRSRRKPTRGFGIPMLILIALAGILVGLAVGNKMLMTFMPARRPQGQRRESQLRITPDQVVDDEL